MIEQDLNIKANLYVKKFWYEQDIKTKRLLKIAYKCGYVTGERESLERFKEGMLKGMKDSPSDINDLINKNFFELIMKEETK